MRRRKQPQGCPVCLVSEAMIVAWKKGWACRGCGSNGTLLGDERVVVAAAEAFDYFDKRGERDELVKTILADKRKIERERKEQAA